LSRVRICPFNVARLACHPQAASAREAIGDCAEASPIRLVWESIVEFMLGRSKFVRIATQRCHERIWLLLIVHRCRNRIHEP
jgi:hypothetical protein